MVSSISSGDLGSYTVAQAKPDVKAEALRLFAKSFSKDNKTDDEASLEAKNIIDAVDQDNNGTISHDELKNCDLSSLSKETKSQIMDLYNNFDAYDKNGDGELDLTEIKNVIGQKQYSLQELRTMAAESKGLSNNGLSFNNSSENFTQNIIKNYAKEESSDETVSYEV